MNARSVDTMLKVHPDRPLLDPGMAAAAAWNEQRQSRGPRDYASSIARGESSTAEPESPNRESSPT